MRIAILATHHGDYSAELASTLARDSHVLLCLDAQQMKNDCGTEQLSSLKSKGKITIFARQGAIKFISFLNLIINISTFRPDIVIAHAHYDGYILLLHTLISRLFPLYLIVHDPLPHAGNDAALAARAASRDRRGRALASAFIVHGAFCARQLRQTGVVDGRPVLVVPHGPMLRPEQRTAPEEPPFVLMFGRMEAYKGVDVLLAACQRLQARGTPIRCKIMGRGDELERRKLDFEAAGAEVSCQFIPREAAILALQQASVVVAPYTEATQSGVVSAAFAAGRPLVASAVGGIVDFVRDGENGLLTPPGDPEALAEALLRLISDPALWRRLADGAEATARNEISWDRFAEEVYAANRSKTVTARPST